MGWINFWKTKKKIFSFFLFLIVGLLLFNALKLSLNENANQIFSDKETLNILKNSENKEVIITINTEESDFEGANIKNKITRELNKKFPNLLTVKDERNKNSSLSTFYNNIPFFLEESDYNILKKRVVKIDSILNNNHESLFSPSSYINKEYVFKDPLGITNLIKKRHADIFTNLIYNKQNIEEEILFIKLLDTEILKITPFYQHLNSIKKKYNKDNIKISFFSTSFIPVANSLQIKEDLRLTLSFTIISVFTILIISFRNYLIPFLFILPALFGIIFSLALIYWFKGEISGIAIGAGAVIFGIIIDYSFHFFSHQNKNENSIKTIKTLYKPLLFSAFTTIMAFFALTLTNSKVLNDFGWFAVFGLVGSLLFVLLILPIFSPKTNRGISNQKSKFNLQIPNKLNNYLAISILIITTFFIFKADEVSFDTNIENLNFFPEELKNVEKEIFNINIDKERSIVLFIENENKEIAKEKNLELLSLLKDFKKKKIISNYSNLSLFDLPKENIIKKKKKWIVFWQENKENVIKKIKEISLKNGYNKDVFSDFIKLINSDPEFTVLGNESLNKINKEGKKSWITKSMITVKKENTDAIIKLLDKNNINYLNKSAVATNMLIDIKDDFNFLLFYTGILVFLTLFLIYGRLELALITFTPMLISWIWIIGICATLDIQFNFVNIIISTLIFGIGDDFAIFISDGYLRKYKTNDDIISVNFRSITLSALTTIIALGSLMFAKHPAIYSIAPISIIGIISILAVSIIVQPFLYKLLIINRTNKGLGPVTLSNFASSLFSYTLFVFGSLFLSMISLLLFLVPFSKKIFKPLFHIIIQKISWLIVFVAITVRTKRYNYNLLNFKDPSIIIANHQSFVDILQMLILSPKLVLVVKNWVYYSPIFGGLIRYLGFVTITDGIDKNMANIKQLFSDGYSIMIFPEGKRSKSDKIGRFHKGAFLIAEKLKSDITPILLHGYGNAIRKNDFIISKSILSYKVLPRIKYDDHKYGINYQNRAKQIKKYFSKEMIKFSKERENTDYLYKNISKNIEYKGPILETYYKIKWRLEKENYSFYDSIISDKAKIYDLGCGYGFLSCFLNLRSKKREIIAIDYDNRKINIAKNYFTFKDSNSIKFLSQDILNVKLANPDVILLNDVLHYLDQKSQEKIINHCLNNLEKGGTILIREGEKENKNHIFTKLSEIFSTKIFKFNKQNGELNFLSKKEIMYLAKQKGFNIEEISHSKITSNKLFILKKHEI